MRFRSPFSYHHLLRPTSSRSSWRAIIHGMLLVIYWTFPQFLQQMKLTSRRSRLTNASRRELLHQVRGEQTEWYPLARLGLKTLSYRQHHLTILGLLSTLLHTGLSPRGLH